MFKNRIVNKFNQLSTNFINSNLPYFLLIVGLFWVKSYLTYLLVFDLGITNTMQQFLLFFNPLSSGLIFLSFALFFKGKIQNRVLITLNFLLSFVLYANVVYYRFFTDFITVPTVMQVKTNAGQLGGSVLELMNFYDIFFFIDTIVLIYLIRRKKYDYKKNRNVKHAKYILAAGIITFFINLGLAETDRPELLTRTFDRNYLVKYLGIYNFSIYDIVQNVQSASERASADSSELVEIENYIKANHTEANEELFGIAEGKNVILISLESFQSFLIDYELEGQEVTPFLNQLAKGENTFFFENIYNQTSQGKTSDAEFILDNALFPLSQGAVYVTKAFNEWHATPGILKDYGYYSAAFHGNYKTFWNRNEMYRSLGYNQFFDAEYYTMDEELVHNYGLKDKPYFTESISLIQSLPQPFYAKFITLSNHFPFTMDAGDNEFPTATTGDAVVDNYFVTANYLDKSIEQFFNQLKEAGIYEDSIIVMYGDHYGISENHNKAMSQILGKEVNDYVYTTELQKVPVFIHVPNQEGLASDVIGGQIDIRSTVLHLLGINTNNFLEVGSDLLSKDHKDVAVLRNGDWVSKDYAYVKGIYYDRSTDEVIDKDEVDMTPLKQITEHVQKKLSISDDIIQKDLLRFYEPPNFTKVNREDYQYLGPSFELNKKTESPNPTP